MPSKPGDGEHRKQFAGAAAAGAQRPLWRASGAVAGTGATLFLAAPLAAAGRPFSAFFGDLVAFEVAKAERQRNLRLLAACPHPAPGREESQSTEKRSGTSDTTKPAKPGGSFQGGRHRELAKRCFDHLVALVSRGGSQPEGRRGLGSRGARRGRGGAQASSDEVRVAGPSAPRTQTDRPRPPWPALGASSNPAAPWRPSRRPTAAACRALGAPLRWCLGLGRKHSHPKALSDHAAETSVSDCNFAKNDASCTSTLRRRLLAAWRLRATRPVHGAVRCVQVSKSLADGRRSATAATELRHLEGRGFQGPRDPRLLGPRRPRLRLQVAPSQHLALGLLLRERLRRTGRLLRQGIPAGARTAHGVHSPSSCRESQTQVPAVAVGIPRAVFAGLPVLLFRHLCARARAIHGKHD